jgi:hypothetical protein
VDALEIVISAASGLFGAGVVWGSFRAKIASIDKIVQKHDDKIEAHTQQVHSLQLNERGTTASVDALKEADRERVAEFDALRNAVVTRDLFKSETVAQNRRLDDIINRLQRGGSTPANQRARDPREEPSDPPLPPPRPRLPSRRDGE